MFRKLLANINTSYNLIKTYMSIFGWIVMLAPLGLVLLLGAKLQKFSYTTVLAIFVLFSVLIGMSLSSVFIMYTMSSIAVTFPIPELAPVTIAVFIFSSLFFRTQLFFVPIFH